MEAHKDKSRDQAEDDRSVIIERAARATWQEVHVMHSSCLSIGFVVF